MTAIEAGRGLRAAAPALAAGLLLSLLQPLPAAGQGVVAARERLDFDRPESWAMKFFGSISLFTGMGVPRELQPGSIELGLEAGWVPELSERERTVGFFGTKTEDLNKTSVFARPRLTLGLPLRLSLTASYVPPVEVFGVEPHLVALALGRPLLERGAWRLGMRLTAQAGTIEGDLVCAAEEAAAGDDRSRNRFGCEAPSRDELGLRSLTLDLGVARAVGRLEPYVGAAITYMDLEFDLDARYSGIVDMTRLSTDGATYSLTAGTGIETGSRSRLAVELFYTALDVRRRLRAPVRTEDLVNVRLLLSFRLR